MRQQSFIVGLVACLASVAFVANASAAEAITKPSKITLDENGVLVVDGRKVFPITLTVVPGADAKAPTGKHAYAEFADAGAMFVRSGWRAWNEESIATETAM